MPITASGTIRFSDVVREVNLSSNAPIKMSSIQALQVLPDIPSSFARVGLSDFYTQSSNNMFFRVGEAAGNTWLLDNTRNAVVIGTHQSSTHKFVNLNIVNSNNVYRNPVLNYDGSAYFMNRTNSNWIRRASDQSLTTSTFAPTDVDYAWTVIQSQADSNTFYLHNATGRSHVTSVNGYFVGRDSSSSDVILTNSSASIRPWYVTPYKTAALNIKPAAAAYAMQSLCAKDLLSTHTNGSLVSEWGPFVQTTGASRPTFFQSGGYNNRPYVSFSNDISMYSACNQFYNMGSNVLNNWLGVQNTPGCTLLMLICPKVTGAESGFMTVYNSAVTSDAYFSCLRKNTMNTVRFNLNGNILFVSGPNNIFVKDVWSIQGFRYNMTTGRWDVYATTTTADSLTPMQQNTGVFANATVSSNVSAGSTVIGTSPYWLDSLYVCDNWLDDTTLLSSINSMLSAL